MSYPRILTIQDISCVGQCSLTVALPIISACGAETCVLPTAVLSTHTGGFSGYTFHDLTDDMPAVNEHWIREGIKFDAIYTGYLGSTRQTEYVGKILRTVRKDGAPVIIDPAMADNGRLYKGFDKEFVESMKAFCKSADYVLPNITEAAMLTGIEYRTEYNREYVDLLLSGMLSLGCKNVILTGVSYKADRTGVVVSEAGGCSYYEHEKAEKSCHGTGDIFASAFVGALVMGSGAYAAAGIAADYTLECIKATVREPAHWYGVRFEPVLPYLVKRLRAL